MRTSERRAASPLPTARGFRLHALANFLETAILLAGITALVLVIGQRLGGARGLLGAGVLVMVMNFASWWFSDTIALAMHRARPLERAEAPFLLEMVSG
jgi:heat shock protein HtpX